MTPPFKRVLVANRGEIAIRIIRACRELGIEAVAVYSDVDREAPHVHAADEAVHIGPSPPAESYLSSAALIDAAHRSGAEAIHPGYGFLSESAAFARAVVEAGLVFVGPPPQTMEQLGDKLAARETARAAGVPITPGFTVADDAGAEVAANELGYPVLLKAAAGGGGRGMRRVDEPADLAAAIGAARREAEGAFGDGRLYLEALLVGARHVEVQLLGDQHGGLAVLGERDCSLQRRHQKLVEESPAPAMGSEVRATLLDDARRLTVGLPFWSAATVEFLVDRHGRHAFLEVNTRLQVEHGVTELVTGVDIVAWQLRVAAGEPLAPSVLDASPAGHAIQVRIYAEDPWRAFQPVAGRVGAWRMAEGPGVRVDAGATSGMDLPLAYDPLLAKLLVHGPDRPAAVQRLRRALDETTVGGLPTTLGFHRWLVDQPAFVAGQYDTRFVAEVWAEGPPLTGAHAVMAATAAAAAGERHPDPAAPTPTGARTDRGSHRSWTRLAREEAVDR